MQNSIQNIPQRTLEKMADSFFRWQADETIKDNGFTIPQDEPIHKITHDTFSVYAYGDIIKVVYIKSACNQKAVTRENRAVFYGCEEFSELSTLKTLADLEKQKNQRFSNNISRAKARIFELAMCNEFNYFCTFTQDQKMRDRFDLSAFRKDLAQLIRNLNRTRSEDNKIKYLLIPEKHKKGAWHMHGLLQGLTPADLRLFDLSENIPKKLKDRIKKGEKIYDFTRYRKAFGFFTCTEVKSHTAVSKYITKYISKDLQSGVLESGKHLYFASQGLNGREVLLKNCTEPCFVDEWDYENDYIKIKEYNINDLKF